MKIGFFDLGFEQVGLFFLGRLQVVQPFGEQQVGDLFDNRQCVGNPASRKCVPNFIDLRADFPGDHKEPCMVQMRPNVKDRQAAWTKRGSGRDSLAGGNNLSPWMAVTNSLEERGTLQEHAERL